MLSINISAYEILEKLQLGYRLHEAGVFPFWRLDGYGHHVTVPDRVVDELLERGDLVRAEKSAIIPPTNQWRISNDRP